jgi:hypothetical protein
LNGRYLDAHLSVPFLKHILEVPVSLVDLQDIDESLFRSMDWIMHNSVENLLDQMSFTTDMLMLDVHKQIDLIEDGVKTPVNDQNKGDFVESSEVYGNYYGVMFSTIEEGIDKGNNLLLVINWEGYLKIKKAFKKNVFGFFITPPSFQDLENRIRARSTDSEEAIKHRLEMASEDMQHQHEFDFCFMNTNVSETANNILQKIHEITNR